MESPNAAPPANAADMAADFVWRQGDGAFAGMLATRESFREILSIALAGNPLAKEDYVACQGVLSSGFTVNADQDGALERRLLGESARGLAPSALRRRMDCALRILLLRAYVFFRAGGLPWPVVGCFGEKSAVVFSEASGNGLVVDPATGAPKVDIDRASFATLSKDGVAEFLGGPDGGVVRPFYVRTTDVVRLEG